MKIVDAGSIELDKEAPVIVDAGSIELDKPDRPEANLSWRQGADPSVLDRVLSLFSDPEKEKARAVNAIVDAEALSIRPDVAYQHKSAIDKYYQIRPENIQRRQRVYDDIKRFNDMGGTEDEWQTVLWKNARQVPYQMQIAVGGIMRMFEENPEGVYAMLGVSPSEENLKTFQLAAEAREKKIVRTLSDEVIASGAEKAEKLRPMVMPGSFKDTAGMATQSALTNLAFLAPGLWMGRGVTLAGMGSQAFGRSYLEQREGGSSPATAMAAGAVTGASEILTEFIPVGIYLKPRASFVRSLAAAELTEIPTETVNQIVNDVTDKVTIRPDMTVEDAIENIMTTIQVTALSTPGISGITYSANKALGRSLLRSDYADTFDQAKNAALMDGATPQEAVTAGIEAVREIPEGAEYIKQKVEELKRAASEYEAPESKQPFILGVSEDANGDVTSFTMADPVTGQTFDVPAQRSEDRDTLNVTPDMQAVNAKLQEIRSADETDAFLDRIIEGQEDIDEAAGQLFRDNIDEMGFVNDVFTEDDAKPETVLDRVKQINDKLGEKGSIDLEPLVNLGRSIMAEGHQTLEAFTARAKELLSDVWDKVKYHIQAAWSILNNERGSVNIGDVTKDKGTGNIPAKDKPQAEAVIIDSLNPTGKIFSEYTPQERATMKLGDNMTTLDKTMGKSADEAITIYRGATTGQKEIVPGDFITTNKQLAKDYAGTGTVIEKKVKLSDILDDKTEPLGEEYIYRPKTTPQAESGNDYTHRPSRPENGSPLDDLTNSFSEDIYSKNALEYFGEGNPYDKQSINIIKSLRGKPDADVKIYRAVDKGVKSFNEGDWVTINKNYAKDHGEGVLDGKYDIIEKTVKAKDLIGNGDSIHEFGYFPAKTTPEVGGQSTLYSGVDPTQIIPVLKSLTENIKEAMPHLEALGLKAYESGKSTYSAWSAEMKSYLGDLWESFKGIMATLWESVKTLWESVKAFNESLGERGSVSWKKKPTTEEINMMLSAAARQDQATGGNLAPESYLDLQAQAAQEAFAVIEKKMTRTQKREAAMLARQGEADARLMPVYSAMSHIVNAGGMSLKSLQADYDGNTIRELMNKRPGLVSKKGTMGPDVFADQHGFESGDDMINAILEWKGLKAEGKEQAKEFFKYYEKVIATDDMAAMREDFERAEQKALNRLTKKYNPKAAKGIKKEIRRRTGQVQPGDRMVTEYDALTEAFRKEANTARRAFSEGKKEEVERSKEAMRWLVKRRKSLQNVRDYFNLTDAEMMSATNRRNPALMDDAEFKQFLRNVELKAVELAETRQEKMALLKLIEDKRLKKVDNYRRALELPTFNDMTAQQLRDFAKLLEPFQDDDIFLTQRELETVDRTDLKGIKTWREARERLAKEAGVPVEELNKVHVEALDSFRWDSALRERDPFYDIMVSRMTEAYLGAELRAHDVESKVYELARKSEKSRDRSLVGRMIPQDDLIMAFLESPPDRKAAIVEQMTPEQIDYANYMQAYFADALNYLIATKNLERGRENYFVHIRRSFLENLKDGGLKKAISELFKTYQQDQMVFNILDDDTGNILPLEKFFQFSLQRTDTMDPTRNVTKAFLTYVNTFERKKMFDAIIPKLDIYAQALTPVRYTPRGLEIDRSLKTYVNKWINNKKGRKISFDSVLRQGGPIDVGIRALRTFTTILDLGLSPIAQAAAVIGEQVTNAAMLGNKAMAIGTARMRTAQGKAILKKYEAWVGRSLWEEFTAPGKEVTERLSQMLFAGFHLSSVAANKQFLLASLTEQEWQSGEISTERLAEMRLDMGRFRVVPGTGSLVGSTSVGDAVMQYKKWAVPIARTLIADAETLIGNIKAGQPLDARAGKELMRFAYMSAAVFIVGAMAGADDDDRSVIGKAKARMYREAMTLMQGVDPTLWLASPRLLTWLYQTASALKSVALMETYKSGDKEGELKGPDKMKRQFVPGVVRSVSKEENKR